MTQIALSQLSGVSYGSLKRFERSGEISLSSLLFLAAALDLLLTFDDVFSLRSYATIAEVIHDKKRS